MARRWMAVSIVVILVGATIVALRFMPPPQDGTSPERAVVLHVPEEESARAEWAWWGAKYPDATLLLHAMTADKCRIYSRYALQTPKGQISVWFATNMRDEDCGDLTRR